MPPFSELIDRYAEQLRGLHRTPATLKNYLLSVRDFATYCESQESISDISRLDSSHFTNYIRHLKTRSLSPLTVYGRQRLVRSWLAWLTLQGHLLIDPSKNHDWRHPSLLPRGSPTESQIARLLETPSKTSLLGQRDRAVLEFLYGTGLRIGECCAVDLDHLCFTTLQVQVLHGKGNRQRVVPFGPKLAAVLSAYVLNVRPQLEKTSNPALWLDRKGDRMTSVAFQQRLRDLSTASGGPNVTAHQLRHAYATHLLTNGAPVVSIQRLLGHLTLSMTSRYVNLVPRDVQESLLKTHPRGRRSRPGRPPSSALEK